MSTVGKIQGRGPTTEAITTQNNDLFGSGTIFGEQGRLADGRFGCRHMKGRHGGEQCGKDKELHFLLDMRRVLEQKWRKANRMTVQSQEKGRTDKQGCKPQEEKRGNTYSHAVMDVGCTLNRVSKGPSETSTWMPLRTLDGWTADARKNEARTRMRMRVSSKLTIQEWGGQSHPQQLSYYMVWYGTLL